MAIEGLRVEAVDAVVRTASSRYERDNWVLTVRIEIVGIVEVLLIDLAHKRNRVEVIKILPVRVVHHFGVPTEG